MYYLNDSLLIAYLSSMPCGGVAIA